MSLPVSAHPVLTQRVVVRSYTLCGTDINSIVSAYALLVWLMCATFLALFAGNEVPPLPPYPYLPCMKNLLRTVYYLTSYSILHGVFRPQRFPRGLYPPYTYLSTRLCAAVYAHSLGTVEVSTLPFYPYLHTCIVLLVLNAAYPPTRSLLGVLVLKWGFVGTRAIPSETQTSGRTFLSAYARTTRVLMGHSSSAMHAHHTLHPVCPYLRSLVLTWYHAASSCCTCSTIASLVLTGCCVPTSVANKLRNVVGKVSSLPTAFLKRFDEEDGFDLDLSYITETCVAMSLPATGLEVPAYTIAA
eukprot:2453186-Rhodomonas_salina.7